MMPMTAKMEYKVIPYTDLAFLEVRLNKLAKEGWQVLAVTLEKAVLMWRYAEAD